MEVGHYCLSWFGVHVQIQESLMKGLVKLC